jgi:hypothetical protein
LRAQATALLAHADRLGAALTETNGGLIFPAGDYMLPSDNDVPDVVFVGDTVTLGFKEASWLRQDVAVVQAIHPLTNQVTLTNGALLGSEGIRGVFRRAD